MAKKINISARKKHLHSRFRKKRDQWQNGYHSQTRDILAYVFSEKKPVTVADIQKNTAADNTGRKQTNKLVMELLERGDLEKVGKKCFQLNSKGNIFHGKIEKNPRGFGFVTDLKPRQAARALKKDPFLSVKRIGTANHGDEVLIRLSRVRRDGRPEAELITVTKRFAEKLTGFYHNGTPPTVRPEDPRHSARIRIVSSPQEEIPDNHVVVVEILPEAASQGYLRGKVTEVLGPADNIDVQMRMVIAKHSLPHVFSPAVLAEAAKLSFDQTDIAARLDLRNICHVTIDGETAKDFDDAVAVEKKGQKFRLYVSIADVAHFVASGTALDKEAYTRGTSIYFPGRVIPMLPEELSNHLCSLVPDEDRLTFSAILDFDAKGKLLSKKFAKSVIRSQKRFTYTTVSKIVMDRDQQEREAHKNFLQMLDLARELAEILHNRRMERGSIGFNIPEPEIELEADGKIRSISRKSRNFAHQIIEEFMLAANEAVAATFSKAQRASIYRIHERPEEEKVAEFAEFARTLGIDLPLHETTPHWFAEVLEITKGSPTEYVVNNLLLRTMQQARYSPGNCGHFGLAATDYTHFTSPIRRYPDLIVHRLLQSLLENASEKQWPAMAQLEEKANHLSNRERAAINAERNMADRLKIFFMEQFIGEDFQAVISGISENVIFIELIDLFVSGSIDISRLEDDYYLYDIKRHRFIGEISGKTYQIGDAIKVALIGVDHYLQRIHFVPAGK